jgi:tetratricopeptide (TPR) repeat protein/nucleoside phosphorylase
MTPAWVQQAHHVDVIILTVLPSEFNAVLQVDAAAVAGSTWDLVTGPSGLPVAFRPFQSSAGRPLRVAVARSPDRGATAATQTLMPLVEELRPRCVAMCGVCAGRRGKVSLGDVVVAERLFYRDTGKQLRGEVEQDLTTYKLRDDWKSALEAMDVVGRFSGAPWFEGRPIATELREARALVALRDRVADPWNRVDPALDDRAWREIVASLRERGLLASTASSAVTVAGRQLADELEFQHRGQLPDPSPAGAFQPFRLHVAPMASGSQTVDDDAIWGFITPAMRKTLALETEGAALAELAHRQRQYGLDAIVMKGVMDFADHGRDPHFQAFAARASAECLLAFLREHIATEVAAGFDDLLGPGTSLAPTGEPSPTTLLLARHTVVPWFNGDRGALLQELDAWADDPRSCVAIKLLHGVGGVGKTRLAIEWVQRRRRGHDVAGFLMPNPGTQWLERLCRLGPPVLVVVDYAERRADLIELLMRVVAFAEAEGPRRRVRLLLLARSDGDWWTDLRTQSGSIGALLQGVTPEKLSPLATARHDRDAVFREAAAAFAAVRGNRSVPGPPIAFTDPRFERVLYIHMAALAAVEGAAFDARTLMDVVLDHEEHFWLREAQNRDNVAVNLPLVREIMAAATLRGALATRDVARATFDRIATWQRTREDEAQLELLHQLYERDGESAYLPGLEPDLLGEAMVLRVARVQNTTGALAGTLWITRVFAARDDETSLTAAFTVLGRASIKAAQEVRPWITNLLRADLPTRAVLALRAAKAIGHETTRAALGNLLADALEERGDIDIAIRLEREDIPSQSVSLQRVIEWRSRKLLENAKLGEDAAALRDRAAKLARRARAIASKGQRGAAIAPMQDAVNLYRRLTRRGCDEFQPHLAANLCNLGGLLGELGRRDQALTVALSAVDLYRALSSAAPGVHDAGFAVGLNNLGTIWNAQGDHHQALAVIRGAVAIYRKLAARDPETFTAPLATSLNNFGIALADQAQYDRALKQTREAVRLYRQLARGNFDAFAPDLAWTYHNLGIQLSRVGKLKPAYEFTIEAVKLYRQLAALNVDAFQDRLAMCLANLGVRESERGDRKAAITALHDAAERFRRLASQYPEQFQACFAVCLVNLGDQWEAAGRPDEALKATREAVKQYRDLAAGSPPTLIGLGPSISFRDLVPWLPPPDPADEVAVPCPITITWRAELFQVELARRLSVLSHRLARVGDQESAIAAASEAAVRYRGLAHRKPADFVLELVRSLAHLGDMLTAYGQHEDALQAAREAVDWCRTLVARRPETFELELAKSLCSLSNRLSAGGCHELALTRAHEAVSLLRKDTGEALQPDLAHACNVLGMRWREVGQTRAAITATQEAVTIYRALVAAGKERFQPGFAASLNNLGALLGEDSRHEAAIDATREAVDLRRALAPDDPSHTALLIASLRQLGDQLAEVGRHAAAHEARREGEQLQRKARRNDTVRELKPAGGARARRRRRPRKRPARP